MHRATSQKMSLYGASVWGEKYKEILGKIKDSRGDAPRDFAENELTLKLSTWEEYLRNSRKENAARFRRI